MKRNILLASGITAALISLGTTASAANVAAIEGGGTGAVTLNSSPVITAILSQPGTVNGDTYTGWSFLVQDSSGSLDVYGKLPTGSTYTPTVGDAVSLSGTYSPYHQIPEIGTLTSISGTPSGTTVPGPLIYTIPQLTASTTIPFTQAGYLVQLDNVTLYTDSAATIPASGNFPTATGSAGNVGYYAKDNGGNIMEVYFWPSSYSTDAAMLGSAIPTGQVDITGFVSQSGTFPVEMTPYAITAVPEPGTMALAGAAAALALAFRRRR